MKLLPLFVVLLLARPVFGQQFIFHADTATITDPYALLLRAEIDSQKAWFVDLLRSDMTEKRLIREYSHVAKSNIKNKKRFWIHALYRRVVSRVDTAEIKNEIENRIARLVCGHYNLLMIAPSRIALSGIVYADTLSYGYIGAYTAKSRTTISLDTGQVFQYPPMLFRPDPGDVIIKSIFYDSTDCLFRSTPIHEFSHQSTDIERCMHAETIKILRGVTIVDRESVPRVRHIGTGVTYAYFDNPSEIKARLDAMRYLLFKYGYYDARTEEFKPRHLQQLKRDPLIRHDANVQDLFYRILYKKRHLVWMLNNIA